MSTIRNAWKIRWVFRDLSEQSIVYSGDKSIEEFVSGLRMNKKIKDVFWTPIQLEFSDDPFQKNREIEKQLYDYEARKMEEQLKAEARLERLQKNELPEFTFEDNIS